ncbi:TlpA disulfide reductase family protein [Paraliobacillus sp. PM-2]|uniref:TlpA disulfide reductase family protein n=1 Tax=Paraliobacillus sp. PM-2 TaxID=1462524 RepID=UPI000B825E8C|nr:TlpA disulfide reductase family protein [Paraliobacillus sp. PM-2]
MQSANFVLPYINQPGTFTLSDYKGKIIILTFWVSWCPDCSTDLPKKEQIYRSMNDNNIEMVTINVTERERSHTDAENYTAKFLSQPTLKDNGREVYDFFQCEGVPTTVIINQHGEIVRTFGEKDTIMEIIEAIGAIL